MIKLPMQSSVVSGRFSHTGRVPCGRRDTALAHSLAHTLSLILRHSPLTGMWRPPLLSHKLNICRHKNGLTLSKHCGVGTMKLIRPVNKFMAFVFVCSWLMDEGIFKVGDPSE